MTTEEVGVNELMEEIGVNMESLFGGLMPKRTRRRKMRVADALKALCDDEAGKMVDMDRVQREALLRAEESAAPPGDMQRWLRVTVEDTGIGIPEEALERIERTTKRVQAFARPRGLELQDTSVNAAVEATLPLLETHHAANVQIRTELGDVPLVGFFAAGEIGHQTIDPDGPWCGCGNRGCLEAYASKAGIGRRLRQAIEEEALLRLGEPIATNARRCRHGLHLALGDDGDQAVLLDALLDQADGLGAADPERHDRSGEEHGVAQVRGT